MDIYFNQDGGGGWNWLVWDLSHVIPDVAIKVYIPVNFLPLPLFSKFNSRVKMSLNEEKNQGNIF